MGADPSGSALSFLPSHLSPWPVHRRRGARARPPTARASARPRSWCRDGRTRPRAAHTRTPARRTHHRVTHSLTFPEEATFGRLSRRLIEPRPSPALPLACRPSDAPEVRLGAAHRVGPSRPLFNSLSPRRRIISLVTTSPPTHRAAHHSLNMARSASSSSRAVGRDRFRADP